MAPTESDLSSGDLEWISDFVMQQMVIMLRPVMDHLQQSDLEVDHTQRMLQQLSMSISEVQGEVDRNNKCLAILRQGLGVQSESRCLLQRDLEGAATGLKLVEEQMESMKRSVRSLEGSVTQQGTELRATSARQESTAKATAANTNSLEALQAKLDALSNDTCAVKEDLLSSEARMETWQKELRELRCFSEKTMVDPWPQKKPFPAAEVGGGGSLGNGTNGLVGARGIIDPSGSRNSSSQQSRQLGRAGSSSGRGAAARDGVDFDMRPRSGSRPIPWGKVGGAPDTEDGGLVDPSMADARLPMLVARRSGNTGPPDRIPAEAPRLRFTATMSKPPAHSREN